MNYFNSEGYGLPIRETSSFKCKKWTLFALCVIGYIIAVIFVTIFIVLVSTQDMTGKAMGLLILLIVVVGIVLMVVPSIGLVATYKEHYGMAMAFAVLMTLTSISTFSALFRDITYLSTLVYNLIVTALAYSFAMDCNKIRLNREVGRFPVIQQTPYAIRQLEVCPPGGGLEMSTDPMGMPQGYAMPMQNFTTIVPPSHDPYVHPPHDPYVPPPYGFIMKSPV